VQVVWAQSKYAATHQKTITVEGTGHGEFLAGVRDRN
jgi:hypothetical protein